MKRYVLGIVFDQYMENVLLLQRNKQPYIHLYNGVGGKIEDNETPIIAMKRELEEETGLKEKDITKCKHLTTLLFEEFTLDVFYLIHNQRRGNIPNWKVTDEGILEWLNIKDHNLLNAAHPKMAGDGNIAYFIQFALNLENRIAY